MLDYISESSAVLNSVGSDFALQTQAADFLWEIFWSWVRIWVFAMIAVMTFPILKGLLEALFDWFDRRRIRRKVEKWKQTEEGAAFQRAEGTGK